MADLHDWPYPWDKFETGAAYMGEGSALETDHALVGNLRDRPYSLWVALKANLALGRLVKP